MMPDAPSACFAAHQILHPGSISGQTCDLGFAPVQALLHWRSTSSNDWEAAAIVVCRQIITADPTILPIVADMIPVIGCATVGCDRRQVGNRQEDLTVGRVGLVAQIKIIQRRHGAGHCLSRRVRAWLRGQGHRRWGWEEDHRRTNSRRHGRWRIVGGLSGWGSGRLPVTATTREIARAGRCAWGAVPGREARAATRSITLPELRYRGRAAGVGLRILSELAEARATAQENPSQKSLPLGRECALHELGRNICGISPQP